MKRIPLFVLSLALLAGCKEQPKAEPAATADADGPAKVTVQETDGKFTLQVNGEPFYIRGAGLEFGNVPALAAHNGNSFRTWRTENGQRTAQEVLDEAHANGLMVTMGIEVARERHGFDYDDSTAVKAQLEDIRRQVVALKDHPALLIWGIGNELNLHYTNPKVWDAVNEISEMIHEEDPNHLTTTSLAGISEREIDFIKTRCPDLDILAVQMYGDLPDLPRLVREFGWEGPYMVTEWGATGHWEVPKTSWGAPIEEHSSVKAANYLKRYQGGIESDSLQCLGSYVFLWGNKQERTPTWYGIFLEDGQETESVDVMHYIWNGAWPENRTPQIGAYTLDGKTAYESVTLKSGVVYTASAVVTDPEGDGLTYRWEVLPESTDLGEGGDYEERPHAVTGLFRKEAAGQLELEAPSPGAYRLFVYATDGNNHSATANIPFLVE
ncbi:glycoside hydrolase family 2 TIM barrel-domain containing protein [Robiginitalea sp. M366]|uniref:glycoside hydrolase family 2 TIM barrel-domain containing protein n=1 Tax=Robiginitalea aestuariiviva TaxID=3036903 RepID=UPI00240E74F3|nr:glycoside hydrolase family 2 TIM barrel-domain containing protein [Robiginitalea aestuariiviva]MDG1572249.1 glycoside hydrolase family 2 TIM barrel-domain containing protein [Robiginitalea aestuariiviva]